MELAQRTKIAISWWLASELVRRHPELTVVETHPGDGTYDCLELVPSRRDHAARIVLNRAGSAHVAAADGGSSSLGDIWSAHLRSPDPHVAVRTLEEAAGLIAPVTTPATARASLVYRVTAAVLALGRDAKEPWDALNGYDDRSGVEDSGRRPFVERFGVLRPDSPVHAAAGPFGEPSLACWGLHRGDETLVVLHTAGFAFLGQEVVDLMDLYRPRRRLAPVLIPVLEAMEL